MKLLPIRNSTNPATSLRIKPTGNVVGRFSLTQTGVSPRTNVAAQNIRPDTRLKWTPTRILLEQIGHLGKHIAVAKDQVEAVDDETGERFHEEYSLSPATGIWVRWYLCGWNPFLRQKTEPDPHPSQLVPY